MRAVSCVPLAIRAFAISLSTFFAQHQLAGISHAVILRVDNLQANGLTEAQALKVDNHR